MCCRSSLVRLLLLAAIDRCGERQLPDSPFFIHLLSSASPSFSLSALLSSVDPSLHLFSILLLQSLTIQDGTNSK